jgi:hypothetical protein
MNNQQKILSTVTILLSVIPGFLILKQSLGVPEEDLEKLFFAVVEATGCLTILIIYMNKSWFATLTSKNKLNKIILSFGIFLGGLTIYIFLFNTCVIETPNSKGFLPLFGTDELLNEISKSGGKAEFVEFWLRDGVKNIVQRTSSFQLTVTVLLFLFLYVITLVSLVASFAIITVNLENVE